MQRTILTLIGFWFVLILTYLLVTNYIGAGALLGAADKTGVDVTRTLQGR